MIYLLLLAGCQQAESDGLLSKRFGVCSNVASADIAPVDDGPDFVFGTLKRGNIAVRYYIGSEPGQLGDGRLLNSVPLDEPQFRARRLLLNTFADGIESVVVAGLRDPLDGTPKTSAQFFFDPHVPAQFELAKEAAYKTNNCVSR
ncbi:hypothetical protein [Lysobacter claricitrinus]|uniref:hypothetical protein n=1 Tax=Lysobacter claricitrinus TaxID=3367728 RepID=UPI0038B3A7D2